MSEFYNRAGEEIGYCKEMLGELSLLSFGLSFGCHPKCWCMGCGDKKEKEDREKRKEIYSEKPNEKFW